MKKYLSERVHKCEKCGFTMNRDTACRNGHRKLHQGYGTYLFRRRVVKLYRMRKYEATWGEKADVCKEASETHFRYAKKCVVH